MATPTNKQLREFILTAFNEEELDSFCFDYFDGVRSYFGSGMSKNQKVIELIAYCKTHRVMGNLLANLELKREAHYKERFAPQQEKKRVAPPEYAPHQRNPNQIFVSHSSKDVALAQQIAGDLGKQGYGIFITPNSLRPGEKWGPAIDRGLDECGIYLVLLTPDAIKSHWVQDETYIAV